MTVNNCVLRLVFGVAEPGEITAIMGSSGSGKSTLLNVLTHRNLTDLQVSACVKVCRALFTF